ncbi:MAG: FAD-dependent oxidoreductase [Salinibacterium sp.]|nr:FAD-dependent oxidoreductase [Salinibacterium sp.]
MATTVLGAGYAGIMAANRLAGQGEKTTLVSPNPWFVERIRLHTVASGRRNHARIPLSTLVHPEVDIVTDTAVLIGEDTVQLASGNTLSFDTLIYAVGSSAPSRPGVHSVASEAAAARLKQALGERPQASVTVIGAGLTGVEVAGAMLDAGRGVRIISASRPNKKAARAHLDELRRRGAIVETGRRVNFDGEHDTDAISIDATGFHAPGLACDSGLPTDDLGHLIVDEQLTVHGHPHILGAGDAVRVNSPSAEHLRPACATALPMGAHAADVILARLRSEPERPFALGYALQCVDLGRGRGRVQVLQPNDSERSIAITGFAGAQLKEAMCRMTVRWMMQERDRSGRFNWPAPPTSTPPAAATSTRTA